MTCSEVIKVVLFNINNLISPTIKELLTAADTPDKKVHILFKLIDYNYNFPPEIIDEIKSYYEEQTGEKYMPIYLNNDIRDLIIEYSNYFEFTEVLKLINAVTFDDTKDESVRKAISDIDLKKKSLAKKQLEEKTNIVDELVFDNDPKAILENNEYKKSLNTILKEAHEIILSKSKQNQKQAVKNNK